MLRKLFSVSEGSDELQLRSQSSGGSLANCVVSRTAAYSLILPLFGAFLATLSA
jgi:hypothetical protein